MSLCVYCCDQLCNERLVSLREVQPLVVEDQPPRYDVLNDPANGMQFGARRNYMIETYVAASRLLAASPGARGCELQFLSMLARYRFKPRADEDGRCIASDLISTLKSQHLPPNNADHCNCREFAVCRACIVHLTTTLESVLRTVLVDYCDTTAMHT